MLNFSFSESCLGLVCPPHFLMIFQEKCFSSYILLTDQIAFTSRDIEQYVYYNCLLTRLWRNKIKNIILFFLSSHFATLPKYQEKNVIILKTIRVYRVKWKAFLKGF